MTDRTTFRFVYFLQIFILLAIPWWLLAQSNNGVAETIAPNLATFSVEETVVDSVPTASQSEETPWFKVEKLSSAEVFGDFVVGPGRVELVLQPGQTVTYEISVSNRISDDRLFELVVEDMVGTSDGSQAVTLLGEERGPYSLKDYLSFPKNTFKIGLGERAKIPVRISIPADAEPGGFYGSVLVSTLRSEADPESVAQSPIIARIGTLFFITVPGDVLKAGETKSLSLPNQKMWYEEGPITFNILYDNTGSVHLNPYGELSVTNTFGEEVGFVELTPWFVLPQSLRTREVEWDRELLFGRYTATAQINRGYDDIVDTVAVSFWVLPWKVMGVIFLTVFIIVFGTRAFFRQFEFKRRKS